MRLPRAAWAAFVLSLTLSALSYGGNQATCDFTTFAAPSGYTLSEVNAVTDDGTVVGQLANNKSGQMVAFSHSADGKFTIFDAPNSSFTWFNGRTLNGVNAGFF